MTWLLAGAGSGLNIQHLRKRDLIEVTLDCHSRCFIAVTLFQPRFVYHSLCSLEPRLA